jgi:hypothetical protein
LVKRPGIPLGKALKRVLCSGALFAAALCLGFPQTAWGYDGDGFEDDLNLWATAVVRLNLPDERTFVVLEHQDRLLNNATRMGHLMLIRPSLNYRLTRNLSAGVGYAYFRFYYPTDRWENRIWQQLEYTRRLGQWTLTDRLRLEERLFRNQGDEIRLRQRLRLARRIGQSPWSAVTFHELLLNLETPSDNRQPVLGQHRVFVGVERRFGKRIRGEAGYMALFANSPAPRRDILHHCLMFQLNLEIP